MVSVVVLVSSVLLLFSLGLVGGSGSGSVSFIWGFSSFVCVGPAPASVFSGG